MKNEFNRHGYRLTGEEYEQKVIALFNAHPYNTATEEQDAQYRKAELNLQIDRRLGVDFPADRREELWQVAQKIEKGRLLMGFRIVASYIFGGKADEKHMDGSAADADVLTKFLVKKYSAVLDKEELEQFLGPEQDRVLPPNDWRKPKTP